jgi:hypothetical protein
MKRPVYPGNYFLPLLYARLTLLLRYRKPSDFSGKVAGISQKG